MEERQDINTILKNRKGKRGGNLNGQMGVKERLIAPFLLSGSLLKLKPPAIAWHNKSKPPEEKLREAAIPTPLAY